MAREMTAREPAAPGRGYAPEDCRLDELAGRAPQTQADLLATALEQGWPPDSIGKELDAMDERRTGGGAA